MAHKSQSTLPWIPPKLIDVGSLVYPAKGGPASDSVPHQQLHFLLHSSHPAQTGWCNIIFGGISKHLKWLCCSKQEQAFRARNWVGAWTPWQAMGSHVAILERAKSAQTVSENCMEQEDEPCAFLSTALSESSPYSKLSSSKLNPYLVKPSAFRNMMHTQAMPPSWKDNQWLLKWLYHQN